jgi:hypothetical protein
MLHNKKTCPLVLETGIYQFVAPGIQNLLEDLLELEFVSTKFGSLVDIWGSSYLSPIMLIWTGNHSIRQKIHPCLLPLGNDEFHPLLVFGPFHSRAHLDDFRYEFDSQHLPQYHKDDTVTIRVYPRT